MNNPLVMIMSEGGRERFVRHAGECPGKYLTVVKAFIGKKKIEWYRCDHCGLRFRVDEEMSDTKGQPA
jgi:hypothetical protein